MKKIRKNNRSQKQKKQTGTIFDDVFRTMAQKLPELFIPLINEVFHTDYPEDEPLVQMRNEHLEKFGKVITDSIFNIRGHVYHVECQSTRDGHMSLRMLEYDIAIALENLSSASGKPKLNFPESCVLYIRERENPPEPLEAEIVFPDGKTVEYTIPTISAQAYSVDEIFTKQLLVLLPYYILRYEKTAQSDSAARESLEKLKDDYSLIGKCIEKGFSDAEKAALYKALLELMNEIADYSLAKNPAIKKEYHKIMGGNVLKLESDKLLESLAQARKKGRNEGIIEGRQITLLKNILSVSKGTGLSLDETMNMLNVTEEDRKYCRSHFAEAGI